MSGIVAVFRRDGAPVDREVFTTMMESLRHRGVDGADQVVTGALALGHQHFWTTPEEVEERQPLETKDRQVRLVFDGRLDNREELLDMLRPAVESPSDAALVACAYQRWGERCAGHFRGPFAFVLWDGRRQRVVCARDALGERRLFYYLDARWFAVASEVLALRAHPAIPTGIDENSLARYFAVQAPIPEATYYSAIRELRPAYHLVVDRGTSAMDRYWRFDPTQKIRYRSDDEYAEHFRSLLGTSVDRCFRSTTLPAILMSGGLDSTSIAALAATRTRGRTRTISWVFDELQEIDERRYMDPVVNAFGLEAKRFPADDLWPLNSGSPGGWDANGPLRNPYQELLGRSYREARSAGSRVVVPGWLGDELYNGAQMWLADFMSEGRLIDAGRELGLHLRRHGLRGGFASAPLLHLLSRGLSAAPGWRVLRNRRRQRGFSWLTDHARALIATDGNADRRPSSALETRARAVLEGRHVFFLGPELDHAHRCGVELRFPYWDRDLVEFMLRIPAHQLYRGARYKHVQRNAMRGLLPEIVRLRPKGSFLAPLFERGMVHHRRWLTKTIVEPPEAAWRRFVHPESVAGALQPDSKPPGIERVIFWQCVAFEHWGRLNSPSADHQAAANVSSVFGAGEPIERPHTSAA